MNGATAEFFAELASRGNQPLLEGATGTLRFDLVQGEKTQRWLVEIEKGDIVVSRKNAKADCVVRADSALFEGIASGEVNAMAALLRGVVGVEGDPELIVRFQRLFPGPRPAPADGRSTR